MAHELAIRLRGPASATGRYAVDGARPRRSGRDLRALLGPERREQVDDDAVADCDVYTRSAVFGLNAGPEPECFSGLQ